MHHCSISSISSVGVALDAHSMCCMCCGLLHVLQLSRLVHHRSIRVRAALDAHSMPSFSLSFVDTRQRFVARLLLQLLQLSRLVLSSLSRALFDLQYVPDKPLERRMNARTPTTPAYPP